MEFRVKFELKESRYFGEQNDNSDGQCFSHDEKTEISWEILIPVIDNIKRWNQVKSPSHLYIQGRGGHFFTEDRKPNRTEPKCQFFWFFDSASVFNSAYFGLRLRFSPLTELKYRNNWNICKPFPTWQPGPSNDSSPPAHTSPPRPLHFSSLQAYCACAPKPEATNPNPLVPHSQPIGGGGRRLHCSTARLLVNLHASNAVAPPGLQAVAPPRLYWPPQDAGRLGGQA
jgi:hypothetical protein